MKKRNIIKKSNILILGRYDLGEIEQKILLLCITQIDKDDKNFEYKFPINEVVNNFVYHKDTSRLKKQAKQLQGRVVEIPQEKKNDFLFITMITKIQYKDSILTVKFSEDIIPYLVEFKENFTKYHIKNVINLNSKYSIRFYELLKKEHFKINNKVSFTTVTYELDFLFDIFKIPKSLQKISKFKDKILNVIKKEINEKTDIFIDYELIKTSRKFTDIKFIIKNNIDTNNKKYLINSEYYKNIFEQIEKMTDEEKNFEKFEFVEMFFKNVINSNFINKIFLIDNKELIFKDYEKGLFNNYILKFYDYKEKENIEIKFDNDFMRNEDVFLYLSSKII